VADAINGPKERSNTNIEEKYVLLGFNSIRKDNASEEHIAAIFGFEVKFKRESGGRKLLRNVEQSHSNPYDRILNGYLCVNFISRKTDGFPNLQP
jgi:hypothetical protein